MPKKLHRSPNKWYFKLVFAKTTLLIISLLGTTTISLCQLLDPILAQSIPTVAQTEGDRIVGA